MAIQLGLRGAWPVIEGEDPTDRETEAFLTHARRSVMKDRLSKKERMRKNDYHHEGGLAELGILGTKRKEPTGCDSIIGMHETEPFSFATVPMGPTLSPAAFHRQQLAQHHNTSEHTTIDLPVCHPMYVAGNQQLQEHRAGHTRREEEGFPGSCSWPRAEWIVYSPQVPGRKTQATARTSLQDTPRIRGSLSSHYRTCA
jgi:hypothetical protein